MKELEARLNAAATAAGLPAGYILSSFTDTSDGWADYVGYTVEGPDVERAHSWLCAALRKSYEGLPATRSGHTRYAEVRTSRGVAFVCRGRFWIGD